MQRDPPRKVALNLTGGGARAAYQVGALRAIGELFLDSRNPFPIICGTSAGAINAAVLAAHARDFREGVQRLLTMWEAIHAHQVYRCDSSGAFTTALEWLKILISGGLGKRAPTSLLDNAPLGELLRQTVAFEKIEEGVAAGALYALGITALGYTSGVPITFFQGCSSIEPWTRARRRGVRAEIDVRHLMGSCAIPFIFPAVRIDSEYFGDGAMRQIAPITPALHLGAERVLIVSAGRMTKMKPERAHEAVYPSIAQIGGHAIDSIFLDNVEADLERIELINTIIHLVPEEKLLQSGPRRVQTLLLSPSVDIETVAVRYADCLPRSVRVVFGGAERMRRSGAVLLSYLLFHDAYCKDLIALGYKDAMARREDLVKLLS